MVRKTAEERRLTKKAYQARPEMVLKRRALHERQKHSGYFKWNHLLRTYGLTKDAFIALLEKQNNICPVCHKVLNIDVVVDHDRQCCPTPKSCGKCIRGALHRKCNAALGMLDDSPDAFRNAAAYLERTADL